MSRSPIALLLLFAVAPVAPAGLYTPDEPCPFTVKPDGTAEPLPYRQFQILHAEASAGLTPVDATNPGTLDWPTTDDGSGLRSTAAGLLAQRLAARHPKAQRLAGADLAGYTVTLIRLGENLQAIQRLQSERSRDYLLLANLTHAYASNGDWSTAAFRLSDTLDTEPTVLPGTSAVQMTWLRTVDRAAYRLWLRQRQDEATNKPPIATQEPYALFEDAAGKPIRYWASDEEAKKLPADAVAVTQQLALWSPGDVKLLWALAEVYLATGDVRAAKEVFDRCANAGRFTGPAVFKEHRAKAIELVAALPQDTPDTPPEGEKGLFALVDRTTFYLVGGVFAVVALGLVALQLRAILKRVKRPA